MQQSIGHGETLTKLVANPLQKNFFIDSVGVPRVVASHEIHGISPTWVDSLWIVGREFKGMKEPRDDVSVWSGKATGSDMNKPRKIGVIKDAVTMSDRQPDSMEQY